MKTNEQITKEVRRLLDIPFWIMTLSTGETYQRFEDDSIRGSLMVMLGGDGDAYCSVIQERDPDDFHMSMRFRMPMQGGGQSPRVRNALLILAEAIRLDNEEHPQARETNPQHEDETQMP